MTATIGARCRRARMSAGLSIAQAASLLRIMREALSEIEDGTERGIATVTGDSGALALPAMAEIYGVSIAWLRDGTPTPISEETRLAIRNATITDRDRRVILAYLETLPPGAAWSGRIP